MSKALFSKVMEHLGFTQPTPVQEKAFGPLFEGLSVNALSPTGSGKTLAFLLPLLLKIKPAIPTSQLLILVPTRELGMQVFQVVNSLLSAFKTLNTNLEVANESPTEMLENFNFPSKLLVQTLFGGQKRESQRQTLEQNPHVLIGTPGRVLDFLQRDMLSLQGANALVLDEADLMVGMGFLPQVETIYEYLPKNIQVACFSATSETKETKPSSWEFLERITNGAVVVSAHSQMPESLGVNTDKSEQHFIHVVNESEKKHASLLSLLQNQLLLVTSGIIFCQTRESAATLSQYLQKSGISCAHLSGELGQVERNSIMRRFKSQGMKYLVATNVVARGIDIESLGIVINYELPSVAAEYVHRVGRTGRAGKSSLVLNLCYEKSAEFLKHLLADEKISLLPFSSYVPLSPLDKETTSEPAPVEQTDPIFFRKLYLNKGKKDKIRPGDVVGTFIQGVGLQKLDIGSIFIYDNFTHVEINSQKIEESCKIMNTLKLKNKSVRASVSG
jgi:superfamily II DNA/RNA helicase